MKKIYEAGSMMLLPPRAGLCAICAVDHEPWQAHNAQSLFYGVRFQMAHGRGPTWADAVAHCAPELQAKWRAELKQRKAWTQPNGVDTIAEPYEVQT